MKEEPVFWLGGTPGARKTAPVPTTADQLEPVVREACRAGGLEPDDFVVALGGYGSWLVHFTRAGCRERIVWNGKERKLVLQRALRSGGWQDLRDRQLAVESRFPDAITELLSPGANGSG